MDFQEPLLIGVGASTMMIGAAFGFLTSGIYDVTVSEIVRAGTIRNINATAAAAAAEPLPTHTPINEVLETVTEYVTCVMPAATSTITNTVTALPEASSATTAATAASQAAATGIAGVLNTLEDCFVIFMFCVCVLVISAMVAIGGTVLYIEVYGTPKEREKKNEAMRREAFSKFHKGKLHIVHGKLRAHESESLTEGFKSENHSEEEEAWQVVESTPLFGVDESMVEIPDSKLAGTSNGGSTCT